MDEVLDKLIAAVAGIVGGTGGTYLTIIRGLSEKLGELRSRLDGHAARIAALEQQSASGDGDLRNQIRDLWAALNELRERRADLIKREEFSEYVFETAKKLDALLSAISRIEGMLGAGR